MNLQKIVLRQLQHQRKQHEQFLHDLEMDVFREGLDFRPVFVDDFWVGPLVQVGEFRNVVDLGVIFDAVFDLADGFGFVAVLAHGSNTAYSSRTKRGGHCVTTSVRACVSDDARDPGT